MRRIMLPAALSVGLTEQGPLYFYKTSTDAVRNINRSAEGEDNDAGANSDLLQLLRLETVSTRITRFYYYNWEGGDTFDSGLTDFKDSTPRPDKRLRPLYATYDCKVNGRQCP